MLKGDRGDRAKGVSINMSLEKASEDPLEALVERYLQGETEVCQQLLNHPHIAKELSGLLGIKLKILLKIL